MSPYLRLTGRKETITFTPRLPVTGVLFVEPLFRIIRRLVTKSQFFGLKMAYSKDLNR